MKIIIWLKVTVVLFIASLVAHNAESLSSLKTYLKVLALLLLPFVAILTQPDIGTGMVYLVIAAQLNLNKAIFPISPVYDCITFKPTGIKIMRNRSEESVHIDT